MILKCLPVIEEAGTEESNCIKRKGSGLLYSTEILSRPTTIIRRIKLYIT
jgi:hypothetical protein